MDDDRLGTELAAGFDELGWECGRWVYMVLSRPPDRRVDTGEVTEPGLELVRRGRDQAARGADWYDDKGIVEQIRRYHFRLLETARGRDFAIVRDGVAVSFACLYSDGSTAQIEDVGTLEGYRGQGLSRAVVQRAVAGQRPLEIGTRAGVIPCVQGAEAETPQVSRLEARCAPSDRFWSIACCSFSGSCGRGWGLRSRLAMASIL